MGDSPFGTPIPYFALGAVIGVIGAVVAFKGRRIWPLALGSALASGLAAVLAVEASSGDPLTNTDRGVISIATALGALAASSIVGYVRWVRSVFRRAEERTRGFESTEHR